MEYEKYCDEHIAIIKKYIRSKITNKLIEKLSKDQEFRDWGFCWCDLSSCDLSELDAEHLNIICFNSSTIWPTPDKMPKDYEPKLILEQGKDPMLGVKDLHKQGITGEGVICAVIDSMPESPNHVELKDANIEYINISNYPWAQFHGEDCLANLCGKNIGIAPKVTVLHYVDSQEHNVAKRNKVQISILKDVIAKIENGTPIRIISRSGTLIFSKTEYKGLEADKRECKELCARLEKLGCTVIDIEKMRSCEFYCGHYFYSEDKQDINNLHPASWLDENNDENRRLFSQNVAFVCGGKCVPEWYSDTGYKFEQTDCFSWTIPQVAGLYALCLQVNPKITFDKFVDVCHKTCSKTIKGYRVVNPSAVIEKCKLCNKQNKI